MFKSVMTVVLATVVLTACAPDEAFMREAQASFADQAFKTALGVIELHKLRTGAYPDRLDTAAFVGEFDKTSFQWVKYEKLADGYALDVVAPNEATEVPALSYPPDFWKGLGLTRTNVRGKGP